MQHVLVALQLEKSSCYNTSIFAVSLLGCPPCFGCPGPSPRLNLPLCMPEFEPPPLHATGNAGLISENLNHVWASQALLTMYEIEK